MISLGKRDARKELGLGFGAGGEMDDSELEEGEACSDHNNDGNYDASIDPDVALSYIDEKLQDVLGHFQKDFEGGVSAENLGAKFGGYGSFLPSYQRSPVWSQTRTPHNVQHQNGLRSPNTSQFEVGHRGSSLSSSVLQSGNFESASGNVVSLISSKASPSSAFSVKQESCAPSKSSVKEHVPRSESINRKSTTLPDQRMLKVRIKVGSDNLSTQKNAAIYSGLGLDVSPSSSLDGSPSGSEGMSHEPQDVPFESPTYIIRIMTSFPVPGGTLLSPLPSNLVHVKEIEKLNQCSDGKIKKLKDIPNISAELNNNKDSQGGLDFLNEIGLDSLACEELVSNTLKLPLLSNTNHIANAAKSVVRGGNMSREPYKGEAQDKGLSVFMKDEQMGPMNTHENCLAENTKPASERSILEEKKSSYLDRVSDYPRKDGHHKGEKAVDLSKGNSNISKGTKAANSDLMDTPKHKADQKVTSYQNEGTKSSTAKSSSDRKKKLKGNGNTVPGMPIDAFAGGYALMAKNKKTTSSDDCSTKEDWEDSKIQKGRGRVEDRYSEFFGDIELDQKEKLRSPIETDYKDFNVDDEKFTHSSSNAPKDRASGKKSNKLLKGQVHPKTTFPLGSTNGPVLDAASAAVAPATAEDSWVCCDKCDKWRLLPLGRNVSDLPKKWVCSMLNWLPGMNRCTISEEETTNAVMVLNQAATVGHQSIMPINPGGDISNLNSVCNQLDQNHQIDGSHMVTVGGKKTYKDGSDVFPNSAKKGTSLSAIDAIVNEANRPVVREYDILKPSKSSDVGLANHKLKQKEKQKVIDNYSDGGDSRQSKVKDKRSSEEELFRVSKKVKTEGKNLLKNNGCSSSKYQASTRKPKGEDLISMDDMALDSGKRDVGDIGKKRRIREVHVAQDTAGPVSHTGHMLQDGRNLAEEEFSENEYRKEKKTKIPRSDGKESSASKGSGKTEKKGSHRKSRQLGEKAGSSFSQRSVDGVDCLKRDSGSHHLSVEATSSSSKVSGSHKTKANFYETKGSPVESVSSSPLRVSKLGGQRRCSDGEDDGGSDRSGRAKAEKIFEAAHHGSLEVSVHANLERDLNRSNGIAKQKVIASADVPARQITDAGVEYLSPDCRYLNRTSTSDQSRDDVRQQQNHNHSNSSHLRAKGSSSRSKDRNSNFNYELDNSEVKVSDDINEQSPPDEVKQIDEGNKIEEKSGVRSDESENRYVDKNGPTVQLSSESSKKESQIKFRGCNGTNDKAHSSFGLDDTSSQQNLQPDAEGVSVRGKSPSLPPSGGAHNETLPPCPLPGSRSHKGSGANVSDGDNASKALKQIRKVDHANGTRRSSSRDSLSNGHRAGDLDAPCPAKRDSSSQAATNVLKEAKNLKHLADRLKNNGSNDSTKIYFEAALKFLHGASLLETGEMVQSMHVYSTTAKLCEFCAHEYEKSKDAAGAALAYKCTEAAYMRVIHSSHGSANKDRHELQTALQMIPPGESPSSSASDVDNLNHLTTLDKGPLAKGITSPQVAGTHVIAARNRPNFVRLLNFVQEVYFAMEASRKSRLALAAANVSLGETERKESISLVKTALDFSFQDVEGLLRLVRVALEAISR